TKEVARPPGDTGKQKALLRRLKTLLRVLGTVCLLQKDQPFRCFPNDNTRWLIRNQAINYSNTTEKQIRK
ncbi:hypothetical protein, partial [Gilvimarinus chinensis]|uniref:hypothetical protein n=1 Tax=Gilvimarinus chinensis TaxID=396005 RepID=UPI001B7FB9E6